MSSNDKSSDGSVIAKTKSNNKSASTDSGKIKLSSLSKEPEFTGLTEKDKLRRDTLTPIISLFQTSSLHLCLAVVFFAILEHFDPVPGRSNIIDSKVIIALITGLTVQVSAIIIAAFKGLFTDK